MEDKNIVSQVFCPECDQTVTPEGRPFQAGVPVPRHKIPREHPGEQTFDQHERTNPILNWCIHAGLPETRVVGTIKSQ